MSVHVSAYVWEHSQHKGAALLLLLAIADIAHKNGVAFPSVKTLSLMLRMSERQVQRLIQNCETSQELEVRRNAGPHGTHLYRIRMNLTLPLFGEKSVDKGGDILSPDNLSGDKQGADGVTKRPGGGDTATSPEPKEQKKNRKAITAPSAKFTYTPPLEVLAWVKAKGFEVYLPAHLEFFVDYMQEPKNRKRYTDFDAAFRRSITSDWGDVRKQAQVAARHGQPTGISGGITDWWKTPEGVAAMGKRLGVERQDKEHLQPWENAMWFKARVCVAAGEGPWSDEKDGTFLLYLKRAREAVAHA